MVQVGMNSKLLSVNVGKPHEIERAGKVYPTGIDKYPVEGRIAVRTTNLDGDGQADLSVHGGPHQAVYAYSEDNYAYWRAELGHDLPWGTFGENLTVTGLHDDEVLIGDQFKVGTTLLMVTCPRIPCFKLAGKVGQPNFINRFLSSGRSGFYFAVMQEGDVAAGDTITLVKRNEQSMTVAEIVDLVRYDSDIEVLERALALDSLGDYMRSTLSRKLQSRLHNRTA